MQPHHFHAIPLTPELLLAHGFEYDVTRQDWDLHTLKDIYFAFDREGLFCMYPEYDGSNQLGKSILYLHELQNLHLDLTGKQLN